MQGSNQISYSDAGLRSIAENMSCLTFVIERYFHPKVICADQGGTCERLEHTIRLLSRNLKREEMLMESLDYPDLRAHKKEHETILRNMETLRRTLDCGNYDNELVLDFLVEWTENHIKSFDKPFGDFLNDQDIKLYGSGTI